MQIQALLCQCFTSTKECDELAKLKGLPPLLGLDSHSSIACLEARHPAGELQVCGVEILPQAPFFTPHIALFPTRSLFCAGAVSPFQSLPWAHSLDGGK